MATQLSIVQLMVNGGALASCAVVLVYAWRVAITGQRAISKSFIRVLIATMTFSCIVITIAALIELSKFFGIQYFSRQQAVERATNELQKEMLLKEAQSVVFEEFFEPQPINYGTRTVWRYPRRAPNGLYLAVAKGDPQFQSFLGDHMIQRLWADPRYPESWIRARSDDKGNLLVEFSRRGWGCDLTIKPNNNETRYVENFDRVLIALQMAPSSPCQEPVAFCLRLIDGRDNHWGWGDLKVFAEGEHPSVHYRLTDSNGALMVLKPDGQQTFCFDISSREGWAQFHMDGGIAPFQGPDKRFRFIQGVVIEPGIKPRDLGTEASTFDTFRPLNESPMKNGERVWSGFLVKSITFGNSTDVDDDPTAFQK